MNALQVGILLLALLLQAGAALLAIRLIRVTGHQKAWILISGALMLMAVRRVISFARPLWGGGAGFERVNDWLGLAVSAAMFVGIWRIESYFRAYQERERRLAESEATAKALLDHAGDAVEILDAEGRYLEVNRAACELLGYRREDLLGHSPAVLDPRMAEADIRASVAQILEHGDRVFETVHRTRSGVEFPVEIHATPVTLAGRSAVMAIARDISDRKRQEEALRDARKAEGLVQMAGGVAHDFNNLFQVVMANLDLARSQADPASRTAGHIDRARAALERAGLLAQRIQQFSGGVLQVPEPTDFSRLVASVLQEHPVWREGQTDLDGGLPLVPVDPVHVRMVAEAVLANAWEAGPPVRVRTYARTLQPTDLTVGAWAGDPGSGAFAVLDVEDHGPGIPTEDLARLYDPFFSTRGLGRGLGLASALGLVRGHRGAIQVVTAVGLGSAFRVHFPLAGPPPAPSVSGTP